MNLKNIKVKAVALVDKGANRRKFFLLKRDGGFEMEKELALELVKSAKLDKETVAKIIASLPEADRAEVEAFAKAEGDVSSDEINVEALIEKAGAKLSKQTTEILKQVNDHVTAIKSAIDDLLKGLKDGTYPALSPEDAKKKADAEALKLAEEEAANKDISPEELKDMMQKAEEKLLSE